MPQDREVAAARAAYIDRIGADRAVIDAETNLSGQDVAAAVAAIALRQLEADAFVAPDNLIEGPVRKGKLTLRGLLAAIPRKDLLRFRSTPEAVAAWVESTRSGKAPLRLFRAPGSGAKSELTVLFPALYADRPLDADTLPKTLALGPIERPPGLDLWEISVREFADGSASESTPAAWRAGRPEPEPAMPTRER
jgi:hypothetical protein